MYRIVSGSEVYTARTDKDIDAVERLEKIALEYFPELTEKYICLPEPYTTGGYIFNFVIDKVSGMPVAVGCDDLKYNPSVNQIELVPDTVTGSPVFNEDELIEHCLYLRKKYHEILKELKITDIKKAGAKYDA